MIGCVLCTAVTTDTDGWADVVLPEDVRMRSAFAGESDPLPVLAAGDYYLCPACSVWRPDARTAPLPLTAAALVARFGADQPWTTRRRLRSEVTGWTRHLARQLLPGPHASEKSRAE